MGLAPNVFLQICYKTKEKRGEKEVRVKGWGAGKGTWLFDDSAKATHLPSLFTILVRVCRGPNLDTIRPLLF
ncbi:MAG: hypothetical protein IJV18_00785, partial [Acidaminococcaceae bacterium]|nr:hypothetical protein [Acidaminococcaceae bacterium]